MIQQAARLISCGFFFVLVLFSKLATIVDRVTSCVEVKNFTFLDLFPISFSVLSSFIVVLFYPSNVKIFCMLALSCFLIFMYTFDNSLVYS